MKRIFRVILLSSLTVTHLQAVNDTVLQEFPSVTLITKKKSDFVFSALEKSPIFITAGLVSIIGIEKVKKKLKYFIKYKSASSRDKFVPAILWFCLASYGTVIMFASGKKIWGKVQQYRQLKNLEKTQQIVDISK